MEFKPYQHIERLGTDEVEGILNGTVWVYTKIDGTACSCYLDNNSNFKVGSRHKVLDLIHDNAGACAYCNEQDNLKEYLNRHPNYILYGEFLTKNHIKYYCDDAWKKLYVFDVFDTDNLCYISYEEYQPELAELGILYIPLVVKLENPTVDDIMAVMDEAHFLQEEKGYSEGLVIKNYPYRNKYGRQTWAKVVREEYKQKQRIRTPKEEQETIENRIVDELLTEAMIEKEYLKIATNGWNSKMIPRLLNTIYHEFITEEAWNIVKKYKNPTIDFKKLQIVTFDKIKDVKKELF